MHIQRSAKPEHLSLNHMQKTPPDQEKVEEQSIEEAASLSPKMIYEVIRRDGEEELSRPTRSLIWSGIAAGIMISFSVLS